jgi:hypothetical protein
MKVVITRKHCEDADYRSNTDCPLARAIKEQLPDFPLSGVGGITIDDKSGKRYLFDSSNETGWNDTTMYRILSGKIESHTVTF